MVYVISKFISLHPGGSIILLDRKIGQCLLITPVWQLTKMLWMSLSPCIVMKSCSSPSTPASKSTPSRPQSLLSPASPEELSLVSYAEPTQWFFTHMFFTRCSPGIYLKPHHTAWPANLGRTPTPSVHRTGFSTEPAFPEDHFPPAMLTAAASPLSDS